MSIRVRFAFDGKNVQAQRAAERQAGDLITGVTAETRMGVRNIIVSAIRDGIPPYDAARAIESIIGLNANQSQAAMSFWLANLDNGLSPALADKRLGEYVAKKTRERAEMIARTEIMDALNDGALTSWRQAQQRGLLSRNAVKEWLAADDDRTCQVCSGADGQVVGIDQPFSTMTGSVDMPPAHPNCRCSAAVTEG